MSADRIVVVGAAAGGLDALCQILKTLPADFGAPILVVLHIGNDSPGLIVDIVGSFTSLVVAYAKRGEPVFPGHVYIAPPQTRMIVASRGVIEFEGEPQSAHEGYFADRLFVSAARVYGAGTLGVVLTGDSADGTEGLKAITRAGGVRMVQAPTDALAPKMPSQAIEGDHPQVCARVGELGALLVAWSLTEQPRARRQAAAADIDTAFDDGRLRAAGG